MNEQNNFEKLKALLDDQYTWPASYQFKFIVPITSVTQLIDLTRCCTIDQKRPSRTGKYTSVTLSKMIQSSSEVIELYERVSIVPGLISL